MPADPPAPDGPREAAAPATSTPALAPVTPAVLAQAARPNIEERIAASFAALRDEIADLASQGTQELGRAVEAVGAAEHAVFEHIRNFGA